jgi:hypothetical protein
VVDVAADVVAAEVLEVGGVVEVVVVGAVDVLVEVVVAVVDVVGVVEVVVVGVVEVVLVVVVLDPLWLFDLLLPFDLPALPEIFAELGVVACP